MILLTVIYFARWLRVMPHVLILPSDLANKKYVNYVCPPLSLKTAVVFILNASVNLNSKFEIWFILNLVNYIYITEFFVFVCGIFNLHLSENL